MKGGSEEAIPKEVALQLCGEIRQENQGKWFTQCWACAMFSKGDPARMCVSSRPDYRGCKLVNTCYDKSKPKG